MGSTVVGAGIRAPPLPVSQQRRCGPKTMSARRREARRRRAKRRPETHAQPRQVTPAWQRLARWRRADPRSQRQPPCQGGVHRSFRAPLRSLIRPSLRLGVAMRCDRAGALASRHAATLIAVGRTSDMGAPPRASLHCAGCSPESFLLPVRPQRSFCSTTPTVCPRQQRVQARHRRRRGAPATC